jgi:hypothetical protein
MSTVAAINRPRAGLRSHRLLTAGLACALMLTLVGVPTAALAHHHRAGALPGDDLSCGLCLWQSHLVAEPAATTALAAPTAAPLTPTLASWRAAVAELSIGAPRAPPASRA